MSGHVQEQLWAHAKGQLKADAAREVDSHLTACAECRRMFEQFRGAVMFVQPVDPPVLDDAAWSRVDSKVMAVARAELARRSAVSGGLFGDWRRFAAFGVLAAAAIAFFVLAPDRAPPPPPPVNVIAQQPKVTPPPVVVPQQPPTLAHEQFARVEVSSAADASSAEGQVKDSILLGESIRTGQTGRVFVALADGSRAGVVGASEFKVVRSAPEQVRLELARGTLVVAAAHAGESRTFAVSAGTVEVFVVGTRFLVERDEIVTVVVEEGKVEVAANGQRHRVSVGETLIIDSSGNVRRKRAVTPAARAAFRELRTHAPVSAAQQQVAPPTVAQTVAESPGQRLTEEDDVVPPVEGGQLAAASPDAGVSFGEPSAPPLLIPGDQQQQPVASATPEPAKKQPFDLLAPFKRINLKNISLDSPYPPVGMEVSEYRVHQLQRTADRGQCERVLERADAWMTEFGASPAVKSRLELSKAVLFTKARCLTKLGRTADAEKTRTQAEALR